MIMPKFTAEIGKTHLGDMEKAKQSIRIASELGFDSVKFQAYNRGDIQTGHKNYERYQACHLPLEKLQELKEWASIFNVGFFCSVFSQGLIKPLSEFTSTVKIPSTFFCHYDFVRDCFFHFPIRLLSTGFHDTESISKAIQSYSEWGDAVYFQTTSVYPTPEDMLRLSRIKILKLEGLSYHSDKIHPIIYAILSGVKHVELHFTLDTPMAFQWGPDEFKMLKSRIEAAIKMYEDKPLTREELDNYEFFKKEFRDLKCLK